MYWVCATKSKDLGSYGKRKMDFGKAPGLIDQALGGVSGGDGVHSFTWGDGEGEDAGPSPLFYQSCFFKERLAHHMSL